ncbi:MAG: B12-binding domain-containing radical SAM protein [Candidatus Aenigmatarchaeota archaeon]
MKISFIVMYKPTPLSLCYPSLGVGYLSSYVKQNTDFKTSVIDTAIEDPINRLTKERPDIIGISSSTLEFHEAIELSKKIKEIFDVPIIVGGSHISALPHTLQDSFDIGIIGEGEQTLVELLKLFEKYGFSSNKLKNINGIVFHDKNNNKITKSRELIRPLDRIPMPDYDLFNMKYYLKKQDHFPRKHGKGMSMITSRGCPYRCVFCGSSHFWRMLRYHSAEYSVNVMKFLIDKYDVEFINIFDDIFVIDIKRLKEIVKLIREEGIHKKVTFGIQSRANIMSDEICKLLKQMNVYYLGFGLESGSEKILNYLKKGTVTVEDNKNAVKMCKKYNFAVGSGFMVGNPNETEKDMNDTLKFIQENNMDSCTVYITAPLPGTELWEYAKKEGLVSDNMDWSKINQFFTGDNVILSKMDREKFTMIYNKILRASTVSKIRSNILHPFSLTSYFIKNPFAIIKYLKQIRKGG